MFGRLSPLEQRIKQLRNHLSRENPVLLKVVKSFRSLDTVAYRLGLLDESQSFAARVPWWPIVTVLGTFSSGKSTFINYYLGQRLQETGNQAVDDKFTVICYSSDEAERTLPGLALDADPRFPFYQMSHSLEEVAPGEGHRVDSYLQLKTCHSDVLRGKILIDSPGFDADAQRTSTLRLTDHIMDLSDLVLVFFDARHPEPGAMQDTLEHLVANTIQRPDSNKFLYILNQIDNAAREDNPEEVFGAWQRALAQRGLTAGRFYSIYDLDAAIAIPNPQLRERFEARRAQDMAQIKTRIEQVEVERAYRIIGVLEHVTRSIQGRVVPALRDARQRWRRRVLWLDGLVFGGLLALALAASVAAGYWEGLRLAPPWLDWLTAHPVVLWLVVAALVAGALYLHFKLRRLAANGVKASLRRLDVDDDVAEWLERGFDANTRVWQSVLGAEPVGWGPGLRKRLERVLSDADGYVQELNTRFADPSGRTRPPLPARGAAPPEKAEEQAAETPPEAGRREEARSVSGVLEVVKPSASEDRGAPPAASRPMGASEKV